MEVEARIGGKEKKGKESGARRGNLREGDLLGGAVCSGRGGCRAVGDARRVSVCAAC